MDKPTGAEVLDWAEKMFGPIARNERERSMRFIEEATELVQACGLSFEDALRVFTRVYSRETESNVGKEIGQAGLTLLTLAENLHLNADGCRRYEYERILEIPEEEWHRRHAVKVEAGTASNA